MENMVNVYFFGKKYSVPGDLTIMTAMEYAGYTLTRGCGCRHGFCGACATIYRIKGKNELKTCLACQTQVQEGMYIASIPFFPTDKRTYDIDGLKVDQRVMMELYPEIYACVGCNACTKACTQNLNVMQYIAYAQRGSLKNAPRRASTASAAAAAPCAALPVSAIPWWGCLPAVSPGSTSRLNPPIWKIGWRRSTPVLTTS